MRLVVAISVFLFLSTICQAQIAQPDLVAPPSMDQGDAPLPPGMVRVQVTALQVSEDTILCDRTIDHALVLVVDEVTALGSSLIDMPSTGDTLVVEALQLLESGRSYEAIMREEFCTDATSVLYRLLSTK